MLHATYYATTIVHILMSLSPFEYRSDCIVNKQWQTISWMWRRSYFRARRCDVIIQRVRVYVAKQRQRQ